MNTVLNVQKKNNFLKLGEKEYSIEDVLKNFDEILFYFKGSSVSSLDLDLFGQFIDILWRRERYGVALQALEAALDKYPLSLPLREKEGEILMDSGYHRDAAEVFDKILREHPDSFMTKVNLGESLLKSGDLKRAEQILLEALEMKTWDPIFFIARFEIIENLARIYYLTGNYPLALDYISQILGKLDRPSKWRLYFDILEKMGSLEQLNESLENYRNIVLARRYAFRGSRYESREDWERSLEAYRNAIKYNPSEPHYHFCVANVLEQLPENEYENQFDEAAEYYKAALSLFPDNLFYLMSRIGNLITLGYLEEAYSLTEDGTDRFPEYMLPNLRVLTLQLGIETRYIDLLRRLIEKDPEENLSELRSELAILLKERGDGEARQWFEKALRVYLKKAKIYPYDWRYYYDTGCCFFEMDDMENAHKYLLQAMEYHGAFSEDIGEKLAEVLIRLNKFADARLLLEALILIAPTDYEYLGKMGMCFLAEENYELAFEALNRSILCNPTISRYLYAAAVCAVNLKKTKETLDIVKDLLRLDPDFLSIIKADPVFNSMNGCEEWRQFLEGFEKPAEGGSQEKSVVGDKKADGKKEARNDG